MIIIKVNKLTINTKNKKKVFFDLQRKNMSLVDLYIYKKRKRLVIPDV